MIPIRALVSRIPCLGMRLLSCCGIIACNIRRGEYECTSVWCLSLSLSLSHTRSLTTNVYEVCQGPPPLCNPIFETKSKI